MQTREMQIAGVTVTVSLPYEEGHVVTAAEARTLNQTRCENISNALRKQIQALASKDGTFSAEATQKAIALVADYDERYTFALGGGGTTRRAVDPIEKEALSIARAMVTAQLKEMGYKVKDVDEETLLANIEAFAADESVIELAKQRLAQRASLAGKLSLSISAKPASDE